MTQNNFLLEINKVSFGKTFFALFGLGLLGIFSLLPVIESQLQNLPSEVVEMPHSLLVALSLINPLILMLIAVVVGNLVAYRVGLRSLVAEKVSQGKPLFPQLRTNLPLAFGLGFLFAFVVTGLDRVINPFEGTELVVEPTTISGLFKQLLLGLLYGGIVEELMLRWGVMSLLVWIIWRVFQRGHGPVHVALVWVAIIFAAVLFGVGHLPALAGIVELTPLIVFRTIFLNALGGILFGWLYWRHNLEIAMVAHAAGHVGFFLINLVTFLFK